MSSISQETRQPARRPLLLGWLRTMLQRRLSGLQHGRVIVTDPWGEWQIGDHQQAPLRVTVHDTSFYWQLAIAGSNGAAAAYRDGYWRCDNLSALLALIVKNREQMNALECGWAALGNWWLRNRHIARRNTHRGSRRNIQAHYDLDNALFALFLDPTMTYSAAVFEDSATSLQAASVAKLDRICRKLQLRADQHVLEIGTGWGSFAIYAATTFGCKVTTTTISDQQYAFARERIDAAGLSRQIRLLCCDYRDLTGQYDKLVSIEMIEAVGHEYLADYFRQCATLLKPDGQMLLQAITLADQCHRQYLKGSDFIQHYIFPGGCLPSISSISAATRDHSDFRLTQLEDIASHYAETLRRWRANFCAAENEIRALGYRSDFIRLWEFYLCYCEAGLDERYLGTVQMLFNKPEWRGRASLLPLS